MSTNASRAFGSHDDAQPETDTETVEIPVEEYEKIAALQEIIDIKADSLDDADIDDIWIAGFPLGKLVDSANTRSRRNNAKIEEIEANGAEEGGSSAAEGEDNDDETTAQNRETGIEQVCGFSENDAVRHLTANQRRAREIAGDIKQLTSRVGKGYVLDSSEIGTILASRDERSDTKTVSRVCNFIARLGEGVIEDTIVRGKRRIVFPPELANRLDQITPAENDGRMSRVVIGG